MKEILEILILMLAMACLTLCIVNAITLLIKMIRDIQFTNRMDKSLKSMLKRIEEDCEKLSENTMKN